MYFNNTQAFVKYKLEYLIKKYAHIAAIYTYDKYENEHKIQIAPSSFLDSEEWKKECIMIFKEGYEKFPSELISFIDTEEHIVQYEELLYKKQGIACLLHQHSIFDIVKPNKILSLPFIQPVFNTSIPTIQNSIKIARNTSIEESSFTIKPNISYSNAA